MQAELRLPSSSIVPNPENAAYCVFGADGTGGFRSELLAMRTKRLQPRAGANDGVANGGAAEAPPAAARVEVGEPRAGRAGSGGGGGAASGPAPQLLSDGGGAASGPALPPPTAMVRTLHPQTPTRDEEVEGASPEPGGSAATASAPVRIGDSHAGLP